MRKLLGGRSRVLTKGLQQNKSFVVDKNDVTEIETNALSRSGAEEIEKMIPAFLVRNP